MRTIALLALSVLAAFAQNFVVTVPATSPAQAVLTYTAPANIGNSTCRVEVSESSTYSPPVRDVDDSFFTGASLDNRAGSINAQNGQKSLPGGQISQSTAGGLRIFVAGTRTIQKASDNQNYSRALQQGTLHYFRVTCGSSIATGTFITKVLPMGTTFSDLIPLDSNGNYLFPSVTGVRNEKLIDPQTGVLLTRVNIAADNTYNSAPWPTAGGFGRYANDVLDAQGNYHVLFNDYPQGIFPNLYAINAQTGEAKFLGAAFFFKSAIDSLGASVQGMAGGGETVMWDAADANTAYVGTSIAARSTIVKWTYTGSDDPGNNVVKAGYPQIAPATVVDLLGGRDLTAMAHDFNPALDVSKWNCGPVQLQSHYFLLRCIGLSGIIQNVYAWEGAYDVGNGLPLGAGGNGHMVALVKSWELPGSRWCGDHSSEYLGNVPVMSFAVNHLAGLSSPPYDHGGPYSVTLVGGIGSNDTNITVTSTYPAGVGNPPPGYVAGEPVSRNADYFLMTAQTNDNFTIGSEVFRIVQKNSPTNWTVARGLNVTQTGHPDGSTVFMECQNANNIATASGGYVWWDFIDSPDGSRTSDWVMNFGDHPVSRGEYRVDSGYPFRKGTVTDKSMWGVLPTSEVTSHPVFSRSSAPGDGNAYQKHVSMAGGASTTFFDQTYFVGTSLFSVQNSSATTHLTGALYQYHYETGVAYGNGTLLTPKYFPTLTKTAGHAFVDVSGPGSMLTGTSNDSYKYCIANAPDECVKGSVTGNVYFNHPSLDPSSAWCTGGENGIGARDICIGNFAANGLASIQFGITNDKVGNLTYRSLTRLFQTYEGLLGNNLKLTYDGKIALMFQFVNQSPPFAATNVWAIHVPPIPLNDGIDRSTFVPARLSLTPPSGLVITTAQVKFWYREQGGAISTPYCTSRREACVTTALVIDQAKPFSYAVTESYTPTPCANTCTISIPVYPLHTAYYSAEFLNSSGVVVATSQGIAMENVVVGGSAAPLPRTGGASRGLLE